jgi:hypothetical protein
MLQSLPSYCWLRRIATCDLRHFNAVPLSDGRPFEIVVVPVNPIAPDPVAVGSAFHAIFRIDRRFSACADGIGKSRGSACRHR